MLTNHPSTRKIDINSLLRQDSRNRPYLSGPIWSRCIFDVSSRRSFDNATLFEAVAWTLVLLFNQTIVIPTEVSKLKIFPKVWKKYWIALMEKIENNSCPIFNFAISKNDRSEAKLSPNRFDVRLLELVWNTSKKYWKDEMFQT